MLPSSRGPIVNSKRPSTEPLVTEGLFSTVGSGVELQQAPLDDIDAPHHL